MSNPVVEVRRLRKTFVQSGPWPWSQSSSVDALQGVDLKVFPNQIMAVVGQSGSGKTTLSRIILGLEEATGGEVHIEGNRWDTLTEGERHEKRVRYQYVPQDAMAALDPQQTALEHVIETLRVLGGRGRADAAREGREMLERLGLGQRFNALPREMSGGEQRRVTLARVLVLNPKLVVADEPTSGLDPERRQEVLRDLIGNLPKDAACILVTHDMATTRAWCTDAVVMLDGWVIETFNPKGDPPIHPYSRLLFDPWSAPMPEGSLAEEGCPFRLDCDLVTDEIRPKCMRSMPGLHSISDEQTIACFAHGSPESSPQNPSSPGVSS